MNEYLTKKRSSGDYGRQETLPPSLQTKMNQSFGIDFSNIKLYRNDEMAGTGMKGLASGNRVILSKEINLNTLEGQAVLGHELSHIHAQSQGIGGGHSGLLNNAALERQADTEGLMAAHGQPIFGDRSGMNMGAGMGGMGTLRPLSEGLAPNAGAPMQAFLGKKKKPKPEFSPAEMKNYNSYMKELKEDVSTNAGWKLPEKMLEENATLTRNFDIVNEKRGKRLKDKDWKRADAMKPRNRKNAQFLTNDEQESIKHLEDESITYYGGLSSKEQAALIQYSTDAYTHFNKLKRDPTNVNYAEAPPMLSDKTRALDHALGGYEVKKDAWLYRGVNLESVMRHQGGNGSVPDNMVGQVLSDAGYMSASANPQISMNWKGADAVLKFQIKKGDRVGAPLMDLGQFNESEFLLSAGQSLKVIEDNSRITNAKGENIRVLKCELIQETQEEGQKRNA